jgi:hypothetical protein
MPLGSALFLRIDPLSDPRWPALLERHPRASVFHTPEWLRALQQTYGYEVVALAACDGPEGELQSAVVFCRVRSWLTGRRSVSLPFSDHCDLLADGEEEFLLLVDALKREAANSRTRYIEIRPLTFPARLVAPRPDDASAFCLHRLDLNRPLPDIFRGFHRDCVRRPIRRAERESLGYLEGNSEALLADFYRLLVMTRRRHRLPPPPLAWFRNLLASMGSKLRIRIALRDSVPIAAILTLRHKDIMMYKYGGSDARFHRLGCVPMLLWRAIQDAKQAGLAVFDFGRSDRNHPGLIAFKDRWGARRSPLNYWRVSATSMSPEPVERGRTGPIEHAARTVLARLPDRIFRGTGSLLYRHLG